MPILGGAPLMYVFLDTANVSGLRQLFEEHLQLPLIEAELRPPHERHGIAKYDGGPTILSINQASPAVRSGAVLGLTLTFERVSRSLGTAVYTDASGNRFHCVTPTAEGSRTLTEPSNRAVLRAVGLPVSDLEASTAFFTRIGLPVVSVSNVHAEVAVGNLRLQLRHTEAKFCTTGHLLVFYTPRVEAKRDELVAVGAAPGPVGASDIGVTCRFRDPDGHALCLYRPSPECLGWGSGSKVVEIAAGADGG